MTPMPGEEDTRPLPRLPEGGPRKGSTSRISIGELENMAGFASVQMEAFSEAWQATLGRPVTMSAPEASRQTAGDLASGLPGKWLISRFVFAGAHGGESYLLLSEADALVMAGLVSMLSDEELDRKTSASLGDDDFAALSEVLAHAASHASKTLSEEFAEEYAITVADVFMIDAAEEAEMASLLGPEALTVSFQMQLSEFQPTRAVVVYTGELAATFKPKGARVTDTQILPVPRQGAGRSLAEELGLAGIPESEPGGGAASVPDSGPVDLSRVMRIELRVSARVAEKALTVGEVLELTPGTVIQLGVRASAPMGLYVNNHRMAEGVVVSMGERFALQLSQVASAQERIRAMA